MVLTEYDCTKSTAIKRIALNKVKNELIVLFRTANDLYLYYDVPLDIESYLISDASKGHIVNVIKTMTHFRKISSFPKHAKMHQYPPQHQPANGNSTKHPTTKSNHNTTTKDKTQKSNTSKSPRTYKNYSHLWLDLLAMNTVNNREYLEKLLPLLAKMHPSYPPTRKPPPGQGGRSVNPEAEEEDEYTATSNMFSELLGAPDDDDDDSDSDDDSDADDDDAGGKNSGKGDADADDSKHVQCRYLIVRVICSIAENYRNEAVAAQRDKDYVNVKVKWLLAWSTLITCQANIDEWCALLYMQTDQDADPFTISPVSPST